MSNSVSAVEDTQNSQIKRYAIVIGVNNPESKDRAILRYADDDAVNMHRLLKQSGADATLLVSLDENSSKLYPDLAPDGAPTLDELLLEFEKVITGMQIEHQRGYDTEFLLFYSGHGNIESGEGYVVLEDSRLTRSDLFEKILARSPAKLNHLIVDACKSYFLVFDKGPGGKRSPYLDSFTKKKEASTLSNTGFILSASSGRDSHEWERYQAGVFSHEVRSAFRGGADADMDGQITYAELGSFLKVANRSIANPKFRPQFMVQPPGNPPGDLSQPILDWTDSEGALLVDTPTLGHLYVEDALGVRVLDVHPSYGQHLLVHLPARRPIFIRKADESLEFRVNTDSETSLSTLSSHPVQIARKGALHLAFEKLFDTPFDSSQVRKYKKSYIAMHEPMLTKQAQAKERRTPKYIGEQAALWTTVGCAAGGLAMTLSAVGLKQKGEDASQERRHGLNATIGNLNTAAIVFYSIAGAAGVTWLTLKLLPDNDSVTMSLTPVVTPDGFMLGVTGNLTP
ncbi:MAG: caspase family protein [Proteobacteria bacterium]|nr:caspase family protein [Pseudomonadota bacterium]